ncbi:efflux RND transporter periplasmic adaptor subunit [Flavobacterium sp. DG2-3]|uniref:efflux RND transporter periplasmic adaptor subunit n=1 Tax=Flavobacterium sp. DG2-3 TaxID=3068317 RepID=UPI002740244B|nr:efflux RND transporter periplasmic adaptor subunit [Flavobacterium sp. DG2-3]MDP5198304.1 efflux RND transporter periplasmic adaptor subunit [Flavobacterium sp. DG2-3]
MNKIYSSAILLSFLFFSCKKETPPSPKPLEISVTSVLQQDVKLESEYTGQTFGQSDIQINPRVDGTIESMNFKEGSFVKKGQILYTIDPLPYKAKLNEAQGGAAESQARLSKTKSDLDMIAPLAKMNAVSQRELISAKAAYNASLAQIKASDASVQNAKIELGYCQIIAPISGLIGISKVRVGDYVRPGPASILNTISDLGDVRVRFTISEQEFLRLFREFNKPNSSLKGSAATVTIKLSDGSLYPQTGKISFADRQIDPSTGAITFEAAFPNPDKLLRPGQYVKVALLTDVRKEALVIPQRAVIEVQGIYQVYVVGNDNKVQMQIVKPGPAVKNGYIIEEGLKPGDKIAMGGTSLLKNGSVITPKIVQWQLGNPETVATK